MDYIYKPLLQRFKDNTDLFAAVGIAPIGHIDRFKGQYLNPDLHQPYLKPALFIRFTTRWEDKGNLTQEGKVTMEVHMELENYGESYMDSPDQDYALEDYLYQRVVNILIHGFEGEEFSRLMRVSTDEDENPTNTNVTVSRYECTIQDDSTDRLRDMIKEPLDDMTTERESYPPEAAPDLSKYVI